MKKLFYLTKKDHLNWEVGNGACVQFNNTKGYRTRIQGKIHMDYEKVGDGILWVMQRPCVLKSEYSEWDKLENKMYNEADYLEDGEIVQIAIIDINNAQEYKMVSTKEYKFKILGDYSNCAVFEEVF